MLSFLMFNQIGGRIIFFVTEITFELLESAVNCEMILQVTCNAKLLFTLWTLEGSLVGVNSGVTIELGSLVEGLLTELTLETLLSSVNQHVLSTRLAVGEFRMAEITRKLLLPVNLQMFFVIRDKVKSFLTFITCVWFFICVSPNVYRQVPRTHCFCTKLTFN